MTTAAQPDPSRPRAMDQRLDLITVGVPDVDAARAFYLDGLGWDATFDLAGEIIFLQVGHGLLLAMWGAADLVADAGDTGVAAGVGPGPAPAGALSAAAPSGFTFAHNVGSPAEVDEVLAAAEQAGATVVKTGQPAAFGGYHGYFADPVGVTWEVAHNPGWAVDADGRVTLTAVEPTTVGSVSAPTETDPGSQTERLGDPDRPGARRDRD